MTDIFPPPGEGDEYEVPEEAAPKPADEEPDTDDEVDEDDDELEGPEG